MHTDGKRAAVGDVTDCEGSGHGSVLSEKRGVDYRSATR
jgi:hypothetical protein